MLMPVRARSASSISAMRCLPPRLMPRSSSSSAIDAVADDAAVARDQPAARRAACDRARRARPRGRRAPRRRLRTSGAWNSSSSIRTRGTAAIDWRSDTRSRGPAVPSAARATSRSMSWIDFSVSRSLTRARCRGTRSPRPRRADPGCARARRSGRSSQRAQQPAAHRRDRAIDLVQQRAGPPAVRGLDHLEVPQRGRIDEQAVGAGAERDRRGRARDPPSACRAGTARARRPPTRRPGGRRARSPASVCALSWSSSVRRADSYSNVHGSAAVRRASMRDAGEQRGRVVEPGRREDLARPQHRELVGERRRARRRRRIPRS